MTAKKEVFLATNGCPENRIDLARMKEFLEGNDWIVTNIIENADLILFNACGLTDREEDISIRIINHLKARKKPSAKFVAFGCLPRINKDRFKEVYSGITFGSDEFSQISEIIETKSNGLNPHANYLIPTITDTWEIKWKIFNQRKPRTFIDMELKVMNFYYSRFKNVINVFRPYTFVIKISTGCLNTCTYCAVKLSRGKTRSKAINKIAQEFDEGLAKGYSEFALIGTDTGSYGRDCDTNLVALLRELVKREGDYKIRLRNVNPRFLIEMLPELQEIFKTGKISYIGIAAESGNNRILELMNRGYTIEDYKKAILAINNNFPNMQLRNQLMVGFPSETEEEFEDTLRLLDELTFDITEVYMFSPRPNTKAANMRNQIPEKVAKRRYYKLLRKSIHNQWEKKKQALKEHKKILRSCPPEVAFSSFPKKSTVYNYDS